MIANQVYFQGFPVPVALLDAHLSYVDFSNLWIDKFGLSQDIKGQSFFQSMPELPEELKMDIQYCLEGVVDNRSDQAKVVVANGDSIWYEWKISTLRSEEKEIQGVILVLDNITEKKLEELLLTKSQEVARIGGWEVDLVNSKLYWSKITREIHEVPVDYIPDVAKGISFYKEGYSRDTIARLVQEGIENGTSWDTELQLMTAKGNELWVRAIGEPEIVEGKCVRIVGTFQDIDRSKRAEIAYKKVSDRLAMATRSAGIGIWEFDIPKNELYWDANMYRLYGIKESDFEGVYSAWESCVLPEDQAESAKAVSDAIAGKGNFDTNFRVRWPNGEIRWIKAEAVVIRDEKGKARRMIGVNQDITELKTTKLQLVQSEESLQGAFENSSVGMALVALDGSFIKANQSLCKSLGYSAEELSKLSFQDITHPEDLEIDLALLQEVIDGKRTNYQIEKRYFNKKGQVVHIFLTVTAVKKINGELSHFISQIVDMTSKVEASNKLKGLLELTTSQNNSLLNFAHIVSHNLRSHTANLSMITSFLLDNETSVEEHQESLKMLKRAAGGLDETIAHLNEVVQVKLETGKRMKPISLSKMANKVLKDVAALINENKQHLTLDIPKELEVQGVPAYVESVILNLITNAIKYRNPERNGKISIKTQQTGEHVVLQVKDNGLGIDLDRHGQKLFGMYKTFHGNSDARGIGLFITKNQVESMGGSIAVESKVGEGTTFKVKFLMA
ncbi:PAS domain-containing sensor histidine kinase [Flagellimonas meishanensis]|uniref:PAS domain-containing sensor histidine kinase n=1 Tax=Flagellimonas meishanensis TaxID=2873264 RepID=UPI001CA70D3C|nr:PAS domain-containing sensor histidine kinase [[Muricauda] meishanensis]